MIYDAHYVLFALPTWLVAAQVLVLGLLAVAVTVPQPTPEWVR